MSACGSDDAAAGQDEPIIVGSITDAAASATLADIPKTLDAAAEYINDHGGVKGRPIEIKHCDPKNTPSGTITCANEMVQAEAVAIVGTSLAIGSCCISLLENGNVPLFTTPALDTEAESKSAVLFNAGGVTEPFVTGNWLVEQGAKRIVMLGGDAPTTRAQSDTIKRVLGDSAELTSIFFPRGAADVTTYVNQALDADPDWITVRATTGDYIKLAKMLKQVGFPMDRVLMASSANDAAFYEGTGQDSDGVHVFTGSFVPFDDTSNDEVADYVDAMKAAGAESRSAYNQSSFAAVVGVARGLESSEDISGASLLEYYNTTPVPIFMGKGETIPLDETDPKYPGVRYPYQGISQWDGSALKLIESGIEVVFQ
jgi:ABC-type branched-subunit amino acid transport system substrate-binding protein